MGRIRITRIGQAAIADISDGGMVLRLPIQIKRRSGRKRIILPESQQALPKSLHLKPTPLQQALIRGHRWLKMLDEGGVCSLREIAGQEKVDSSYISRMVNLTHLAPEIVEIILDDLTPDEVTLFDLAVDPPRLWDEQCGLMGLRNKEAPSTGDKPM